MTPQVGQAVVVDVVQKDGDHAMFDGHVEAQDDDALVLRLTKNRGRGELRIGGGAALVQYHDAEGVLFFEAKVLAAREDDGIELRLQVPRRSMRMQRRSFMRVRAHLIVTVDRLDEHGVAVERHLFGTEEMSGNGLRLLTDRPLEIGERVALAIELPERGICRAEGVVKRCTRSAHGRRCLAGVELREIGPRNQAMLVSFLLGVRRRRERGGRSAS